jgi:ferredoxin-type protein NapH
MRTAKPNKALLILSVLITCISVGTLLIVHPALNSLPLRVGVFGLGISLGPCLAAYATAPIQRRQRMRRVVLFTGGLTILGFSLTGSANLDLEGFFLLLFEGVAGAAIGHTLITLVIGPLFFGRILCGWGCWRAMVVELLPISRRSERHHGPLRNFLPFASFAVSITAAAVAFSFYGHHAGGAPNSPYSAGTLALLVGFGIYYLAAIAVAFAFHDQRAFCKYLCPNLPILRLTSRLSLLKISPRPELCNRCGACTRACPMDLDVRSFALLGQRIGTGECILCQRCTEVCPTGALRASIRLNRYSAE